MHDPILAVGLLRSGSYSVLEPLDYVGQASRVDAGNFGKTIEYQLRAQNMYLSSNRRPKPMADALDLIQHHRIADNMVRFFIPQLEKELGVKLATRQNIRKTSWIGY